MLGQGWIVLGQPISVVVVPDSGSGRVLKAFVKLSDSGVVFVAVCGCDRTQSCWVAGCTLLHQ